MESTGVYWIPIYEILEARGFEVYLVNARHVKNVPGRKTDILDCQWIQQLHTYGLLRASFLPAEEIRALRSLVRHRDNLIKSCSREEEPEPRRGGIAFGSPKPRPSQECAGCLSPEDARQAGPARSGHGHRAQAGAHLSTT